MGGGVVLLEHGFFGMMVGTDVLMDVVVEVVVVKAVKVVQAGFFCLFTASLFGGYDGCESGDISCGWCGGVGRCSGAGVVEVVCDVRMGVGVGGVTNRGQGVVSSGGNVTVADGGGARWRDCCRTPMGFSESSGKISHIVSHSPLVLVMSLCRLDCKEVVVKVMEALIEQLVGRSLGGSKGLNGLRTGSLQ